MNNIVENLIIKKLKEVVNGNDTSYVCGSVLKPGTDECDLTDNCGSVYGFAIKIENETDKHELFEAANKNGDIKEGIDEKSWNPIDDSYYPLYWGKDKYMGARINAHMNNYKSTGTIQLNMKKYLRNPIHLCIRDCLGK